MHQKNNNKKAATHGSHRRRRVPHAASPEASTWGEHSAAATGERTRRCRLREQPRRHRSHLQRVPSPPPSPSSACEPLSRATPPSAAVPLDPEKKESGRKRKGNGRGDITGEAAGKRMERSRGCEIRHVGINRELGAVRSPLNSLLGCWPVAM